MPDSDGDNDNGLEDYYTVSIQDTDALAWQSSSVDSYDVIHGGVQKKVLVPMVDI